ncbi:hypothetical protein EON82_04250 [bacterium]|nr:MAG: hypothetical protein EON82_04250 [bacterium]
MRSLRISLVAAVIAGAALSAAGSYTLRLSPFPNAEVADGRSQITVSAQVFNDGRAVQDGTQVVFETNLGSFRESVVSTTGGWARATLVTGGVPGTAHITARVLGGDSSASACEVEFVKNREELTTARETIETTSTGSLIFANDVKVLEGSAADKGVTVRYRDLEIHADFAQIDLNGFTLTAKKATVRHGRRTIVYDSLFLDLTTRQGYGLTTYPATRPETLVAYPGGVAFVESGSNGETSIAERRMRFGLVEVGRERDVPLSTPLTEDPFEMADLSASPSTVGARKAVVYARREVQFHRADIFVNNTRVLKFPLFVVNLNSNTASPLVTDELLSVNDNQIALNYPHYLTLKPGMTSLLRFRTGERYGQGLTANRGAFLDYELSWSRGDDMQGGFTFGGVGRSDWVASLRQFYRMSDRTSISMQVDSPSAKSVFGTASLTHNLGNFNLALNATQNQSFTGRQFREGQATSLNSSYYGLSLDRNPARFGHLPVRFVYGLTASNTTSSLPVFDEKGKFKRFSDYHQSGAGLASRLFTDAIKLDGATRLTGSFGATKLFGPEARQATLQGSISLNRQFGNTATALITYNYLHDGLSERYVGTHSLSFMGNITKGNTNLRLSFNKGLGVDRLSVSGEASYRLSSVWRLSFAQYMSQYRFDNFSDYYFILGYRIGWREVGLTWSKRTNRPGIQLMNVNF